MTDGLFIIYMDIYIKCKFENLGKDGRVEKSEIELFLNTLGRLDDKQNAEFAQTMMDDLDFDHNGTLDEDEFIEGILTNEKYMNLINSIIH